jgi:coiled-coil and C2 domain-containing protein 2A
VLTPAPDNRAGYWLWNASTGTHTTQFDPHCPLTSVGCVINSQNVWANVQEHSSPGRISFNLSSHKHWSPLFSTTMEPLDTVQQGQLVYDATDQVRVQDLQEAIEREIRDHVMSLRSRFITRWNNNCGRTLHRMLTRYEEQLSDPQTFRDTSELEEITTSYSLSGFPLHFSYANILHIVGAVERTGLHLTENKRAEFGLSVYVHPYPNDVVSVWVFLVTMIPK